jgi:hypothetical protein
MLSLPLSRAAGSQQVLYRKKVFFLVLELVTLSDRDGTVER